MSFATAKASANAVTESNLTGGGNFRIEWIRTLKGNLFKKESLRHRGWENILLSPEITEDIALKIVKI